MTIPKPPNINSLGNIAGWAKKKPLTEEQKALLNLHPESINCGKTPEIDLKTGKPLPPATLPPEDGKNLNFEA